jgi:hypothetical protein
MIRKTLSLRPDLPKIKLAEGLTREEAIRLEILFIELIGREPDGPLINQTRGGDGLIDPSPEVREKIRIGNTGKKHGPQTPERRAKIGNANRGRIKTPEECAKISAGNRGKKRSPEFKLKVSLGLLNKIVSDETREKLRAVMKDRKPTRAGSSNSVLHNERIAAAHSRNGTLKRQLLSILGDNR